MRAILSVYDKTQLQELAAGLTALGVELFSTGGTKKALEDARIPVRAVEDLTGFPEMMDGRVKTLHPAVHGGILARRDVPQDMAQLQQHGFGPLDMVVGNLYPFVATITQPGVALSEALENIDIGGPTMLRAAAKNHTSVWVVTDPQDYEPVLDALKQGENDDSRAFRRRLAAKAFQHVAYYDTVIAGYLRGEDDPFPEELTLAYQRKQTLRYGENPHQKGALYQEPLIGFSSLVVGERLMGQQPSLCNFYDLSAALETVRDHPDNAAAVVIKHATPSGFAFGATPAEALQKAIHADATSAFGGIIGLNRVLDVDTARVVAAFKEDEASNIDAIVAPGIEPEAKEILEKTRRRTILYSVPAIQRLPAGYRNLKQIPGGLLYQEADALPIQTTDWKVVTEVAPTPEQMEAMQEAWSLLRRIRSNTILIWNGTEKVTLGIGSGQVSRVGAAKLALQQAGERAKGAILASDSFFPFQDSVELAASYGIAAVVQQGGSINDGASTAAANAAGIPMVLTGQRAFWH